METVFCEDIPLDRNSEQYVLNIGKALELKCAQPLMDQECGECEVCLLAQSIIATRNWFWRCSDQVKKRFVIGIVQRFHSVDLLKHMIRLLRPLLAKDYTYARSRTAPGLNTDTARLSSNRALSSSEIEVNIRYTWNWFVSSNYWTKSNFLLGLLQMCNMHLLFTAGNHAKTLLAAEVKALSHRDEVLACRVDSAVMSSRYGSPDMQAQNAVGILNANCVSRWESALDSKIGNDVSDEEEADDPTLYVSPLSDKALVGVAKHRDFIKELPVHLSKFVLGFLDEATLFNCSKVSQHWNVLVDEMRAEFYANQQMWEDIMLMQGSSGVHHDYANDIDVLVPNVKAETQECIKLNPNSAAEPKVYRDERLRSEMNIENAYTGYSARKVIMEERNVFCGSYNVLVLVNELNKDRVIHTCGGNFLAYSKERRCHLIDVRLGRDTEHPIAGHSGSIRCVNIQEDEGFVLTGSYDTSIRKWDLSTLKCVKIYNGHQDSVVAVDFCVKSKQFVSASYDKSCKVWDLDKKTCYRTFKHRSKVVAVALSDSQCISGCEQGRIKVWQLESGHLIKMLLGHSEPITAIRFDVWHIVTASHDNYALAWSNQGNHRRCLTALRHPCPVLCMEFLYLRVITGAEDGRVRIWNMINGQCCRIMRGNSQSDPVLSLHAVGDRLTVNTKTNVLLLTFERIDWNYSYELDKAISLVGTNKYPNTPIKQHSYAYIRAQRMARAGSADARLIHKAEKPPRQRAGNICNSANTSTRMQERAESKMSGLRSNGVRGKLPSSVGERSERIVKRAFSASNIAVHTPEPRLPQTMDQRRVSWAFEHPDIPDCTEPSLDEMKFLLKKQIRGTAKTPDFIYLSVSSLKNPVYSTYPYEHSKAMEFDKLQKTKAPKQATRKSILRQNRPQSSPSSIDKAKGKISAEELSSLMQGMASGEPQPGKSGQVSTHKAVRSIKSAEPYRESSTDCELSPNRVHSAHTLRVKSAGTPRCPSMDMNWKADTKRQIVAKPRAGLSTTATEINIVPMLMYPPNGLKPNTSKTLLKKYTTQEAVARQHPLNTTKTLNLRTFTQQSHYKMAQTSSKDQS